MTNRKEQASESYVSNPVQAIKLAIGRLVKTNFKPLLLLAAAGLIAIISLAVLLILLAVTGYASGGVGLALLLVLISVPIFIIFGVIWQVATDFMFIKSQSLEKVTVKQSLRRGLERTWVAVVANLLSLVLILGGMILFIIPGIYIALRLTYVSSVVANENLGAWESINRSWQLTKNNLWDIIGVGAAVSAVYAALLIIVTAILHSIVGDDITKYNWIGDVVLLPVSLLLASGVYFRYHQSRLEKDSKTTKESTSGLNYLMLLPALITLSALSAYTASFTPVDQDGASDTEFRIEYNFPGFNT